MLRRVCRVPSLGCQMSIHVMNPVISASDSSILSYPGGNVILSNMSRKIQVGKSTIYICIFATYIQEYITYFLKIIADNTLTNALIVINGEIQYSAA